MHSKTKIIVLHMKEVIYTGIFALLAILFIVLLIIMFSEKANTATHTSAEVGAEVCYRPGVYTQTLMLGNHTLEMEITLDSDHINSIRLVNVSESVTTMYPLIEPVFDNIINQIYEKQSLEGLTINDDERYTSSVLIEAIENTLQKAEKPIQ